MAWTMKHRSCKDAFGCACWTQDQIHWACAGNAAEAADGLVRRFRIASPMCRFPLYGREGPDSCPDFDHFGAGSVALQRMLVQEAGDKILLLPAWPADWDADFKLHLIARRRAHRNRQGRQAGRLGHPAIVAEERRGGLPIAKAHAVTRDRCRNTTVFRNRFFGSIKRCPGRISRRQRISSSGNATSLVYHNNRL